MPSQERTEYESVMSDYFAGDQVSAIISMKVDTKDADIIAEKVSGYGTRGADATWTACRPIRP